MGIHGIAEALSDPDLKPAMRKMLQCEHVLEHYLFNGVERNDLETVRYLLDNGICPNMMNSFTRCTVIATAVQWGHLEMAKLARAYGADLVAFYEEEPAEGDASDELLRYADPEVHYDETGANPRGGGSSALIEWLQSRPAKERSAAPPVGTPSNTAFLDKIRPQVEKWKALLQEAAEE